MKLLTLIALMCLQFSAIGQLKTFPFMETETLNNEIINVPNDLGGSYTLIGLAFSKKSEKALQSWFQPVYTQFLFKPDKPQLFYVDYGVKCYFIPMFTGVKRPAYEGVMKKTKEGIDPKLHDNVLFYKGSLKDYKKELNFDGNDIPYFFLLNPAGDIVYNTGGGYSDAKMQKIIDLLDAAR